MRTSSNTRVQTRTKEIEREREREKEERLEKQVQTAKGWCTGYRSAARRENTKGEQKIQRGKGANVAQKKVPLPL